jgi:N-methylhydantoinase A
MTHALDELEGRLNAFLPKLGAIEKLRGASRIELFADARYESQVWELEMPLPIRRIGGEQDRAALFEAFHVAHERVFAIRDPGSVIEFITWKARLWVDLGIRPDGEPVIRRKAVPKNAVSRPCYFGGSEPTMTRIYNGLDLNAGDALVGPCIIEEPTTTIVVFPGMAAKVSAAGNYLLSFE